MQVWLLYSFLALLAWGVWGFLPKVALAHVPPQSVLVWQGFGAAVCTLVFFAFTRQVQTESIGIMAGLGTGFFAFLGSLFFIFALSTGKTSVVIMLTALYPLVSIFLAIVFLGETLTWQNFLGIGFGMLALYFLVH